MTALLTLTFFFLIQVKVYQKLGFIPLDIDVKPIEVALEKALPDVLNSEISEVNFKNVVNKLGDIMYKFPFSLPPFYIAIIRCLGVLEGLALQVRYLHCDKL
jgi:predicted unusual protein kinase regulating ubiquinone biosynthesis (AarF/ABC1/UbiB family)